MKTLKAMLILGAILALGAASPSPTPTPVPTPTPTPAPTIRLSDGNEYTAAQIDAAIQNFKTRINDLTQERNMLAGQNIDLNTQIQKTLQPAFSAPSPAIAPPK